MRQLDGMLEMEFSSTKINRTHKISLPTFPSLKWGGFLFYWNDYYELLNFTVQAPHQ
jgi:hypothetical protein